MSSAFIVSQSINKYTSVCQKIRKTDSYCTACLKNEAIGSIATASQEKAEILNNDFASVLVVERSEALPDFKERTFSEPFINIDVNRIKVLFDLMFNVPGNSYGHVGTSLPIFGTFTRL